jgi:excinuclease ABC subunit C
MISKEFLKSLPENPGIYIMKNKEGKIIYVGKAKNLKNRVNQYFVNSSGHTPKVKAMVSHIDKVEYIITNSENEALNLECSLIKKHRPKYNILLKDDKSYPYIKITHEKFPRVLYAHRVENDNAKYFGPYISVYAVNHMLEAVNKMFMLRECNGNLLPNRKNKPCLNYHIKKCCAPCIGNVTEEEYAEKIKNVISMLSGNVGDIIKELEEQMNLYAQKLDFENAALCRDKILRIKKMNEKQVVISSGNLDEDVICLHKEDGNVCVQMMYVRDGKLVDKKAFFLNAGTEDEDGEVISAFIKQYYAQFTVPKNILVSCQPNEVGELEEFLSQKRGNKVKIFIPERGDKYSFIIMARKNASEAIKLREKRYNKKDNKEALVQLKEYLSLDFLPEKIEAFDISNTAGKETVASMVAFVNGVPQKSLYRKFKIRNSIKGDDYGAMKEAVKRRIERALNKKDEKFTALPDLIFADGGKGQVNAIKEVLEEKGLSIPVYGLVKDDKHRTRDITDSVKEYNIPKGTKCFRLCVSIQDEMHRMAITYHQTLMDRKNKESQLMVVPGIGKAKYKALMSQFKTISAIKNAEIEELMRVKGITEEIAKNILKIL